MPLEALQWTTPLVYQCVTVPKIMDAAINAPDILVRFQSRERCWAYQQMASLYELGHHVGDLTVRSSTPINDAVGTSGTSEICSCIFTETIDCCPGEIGTGKIHHFVRRVYGEVERRSGKVRISKIR